jgi:hypothetical protein
MTFIRAEAGIGERQIHVGAEGEPDLAQLVRPDKAPASHRPTGATALKPRSER